MTTRTTLYENTSTSTSSSSTTTSSFPFWEEDPELETTIIGFNLFKWTLLVIAAYLLLQEMLR